jgi:hypothetical protein
MPTLLESPTLGPTKDPVLAMLLSLFPGGGQIYNGQLGKALLAIIFYPLPSLVLAPIDAYVSAKKHNQLLRLLDARAPRQLEAPAPPSSAVLAYRNLAAPPPGSGLPVNFYRAGLLAILASLLVASAATGGLTTPLLLGATMAAGGVFLTLAAGRERRLRADRALADAASELQAQVISLASRSGGRLTLGQVVEATQMGLDEASRFMESLALAGQVEFVVEDDGGLIYEFTDLLRVAPASEAGSRVETAILGYARRAKGRFTLGELALEVGLPLRDLRSCLNRLCSDGFAQESHDSGKTVYVFPDFISSIEEDRSSVSLKG